MVATIPIIEKYISEWAMPKEPIVSWIKWEKDSNLDKIIFKYDPDAFVTRYLNINGKVFEQDAKTGRIEIPKEYIDVPGFFGFHALYTVIPDEERRLEFVVEFEVNERKVHEERLQTLITRPILECHVNPSDVIITNDQPLLQPIRFGIKNTGSIHAAVVDITFEIHSTSDLKIELRFDSIRDMRRDVLTPEASVNSIQMKGKGKALLRLMLAYKDNLGNEYKSPVVASITLDVRERMQEEIPINGIRSADELPILLAAAH